MDRLFARHEFEQLKRRGILPVYLILLLFYFFVLSLLHGRIRQRVLLLLLFTDICGIAYFFIGAIIHRERHEGVYQALFTTPFSPLRFLFWRCFSLGALTALVAALLIIPFASQGRTLLLLSSLLASFFFSFLGVVLAMCTKDLYHYFFYGGVCFVPFFIPVISLLGIWWSPLFSLIPSGAMAAIFLKSQGLTLFSGGGELALSFLYFFAVQFLYLIPAGYAAWRFFSSRYLR